MKGKEKTIVAVSGGFDPLHRGHTRMFQEAKKLGDELIVILNNDNWLKAKKGFVFMAQEERKELIEALTSVDRVVLTKHNLHPEDMSVCVELSEIRPHIFANGGDRKLDNIPEVPVCEAIGCKMIFNIGEGGKIQSSSWLSGKQARRAELEKQAVKSVSKKIIAFDLDGTLTKSKANLDHEMSTLLCRLLDKKIVAVMGGGNYPQFQNQFLKYLKCNSEQLKNLLILPVSGGSLYKYEKGRWKLTYENPLTTEEKKKILNAFKKAWNDIGYTPPKKVYGQVLEDRKSQLTFSALGQKAPLKAKGEWNTKSDVRPKLRKALLKYLPNFEVRLGGLTSVDITKTGIDKAYGLERIMKMKSVSPKEVTYVGDALYKGGNDYAAKRAGVATLQIKDEEETKQFIRFLIRYL